MGRRKKNVEISEVGKIETKNLIEDLKNKETSKTTIKQAPISEDEAKNRKKWEKLIIKTYKQKIQINFDELFEKLQEKYSSEEEVKNIISELKIKIKDHEYLFKKQWQILKKFNLQEKIYREESKNLILSEKMKKEENYQEAIEKLTAAHVGGFEPASVIKNKIMVRIQQKFNIVEETMRVLRKIDFDYFFKKDARENKTEYICEDQMLKKRHDDQVGVLEKFIKVNFLAPGKDSNYNQFNQYNSVSSSYKHREKDKFDRDKEYDSLPNYHQNKQELKRYEKELEMKAGKGGYSMMIDEHQEEEFGPIIDKYDNFEKINKFEKVDKYDKYEKSETCEKNSRYESISPSKQTNFSKEEKHSLKENFNSMSTNAKSFSNFEDVLMRPFEENNNFEFTNFSSSGISKKEYSKRMHNEETEDRFPTPSRYDTNLKVKDFLKFTDPENIIKFKEKVVDDVKTKVESNKELIDDILIKNENTIYNSKILNDLYNKLTLFGKLTDFEIQIIIYLSHVVVRDLVQAKILNQNYEGLINPDELMDFLKRFKIEVQNNTLSIDGKNISQEKSKEIYQRNPPGNMSTYSYMNSVYSDCSKDD